MANAVSDSTFDQEVLKSTEPVLVDFFAEWCGPCKAMAPALEQIAKEMQGKLKVVKIDVDQNPRVTGTYGIRAMPTLILFKNGQVTAQHTGIGLNFDQRVHDAITLFGRFGAARGEGLPFDATASLGAEFGGNYWKRGGDAIGIALNGNRTSASFRRSSALVDANADGISDFGFAARGWEKAMELYYRFRIHRQFEISPDLQYIRNPAGNAGTRGVAIFGLRALLNY